MDEGPREIAGPPRLPSGRFARWGTPERDGGGANVETCLFGSCGQNWLGEESARGAWTASGRALAAYCVAKGESPRSVRNTVEKLEDFQSVLAAVGIETAWPKVTAR